MDWPHTRMTTRSEYMPESSAESCAMRALRPISALRLWISEGLTRAQSYCKGWNSQAHREFPGKFESRNLSRDNLSREIGCVLFCETPVSAARELHTCAAGGRRKEESGAGGMQRRVQRGTKRQPTIAWLLHALIICCIRPLVTKIKGHVARPHPQ